jgi:predicted cation transporter
MPDNIPHIICASKPGIKRKEWALPGVALDPALMLTYVVSLQIAARSTGPAP